MNAVRAVSLCVLLLAASALQAQYAVDFLRWNQQGTHMRAYVQVRNGEQPVHGLLREQLRLSENDRDIEDFVLHPALPERCPLSLYLVMDGSNSMYGVGIASQIAAAERLIRMMDVERDEVGLIIFDGDITILQSLTNDTTALLTAARKAEALGTSPLYDAMYIAAAELAAHARNALQAVIVMADGGCCTIKTLQDVVNLTTEREIRMCNVDYGGLQWEKEYTSTESGGYYYAMWSPAVVPDLVEAIVRRLRTEACAERKLTWDAHCPDGTLRETRLGYQREDSTIWSATKTRRMPWDSTQFASLPLEWTGGTVRAGEQLRLQLRNTVEFPGDIPLRFRLCLPTTTTGLSFDTAMVPEISPFAGLPLAVTRLQDSVVIEIPAWSTPRGAGPLLELRYRSTAGMSVEEDSIVVLSATMYSGCMRPIVTAARYSIAPVAASPEMTAVDCPEFRWDPARRSWSPTSADLRFRISNHGDAAMPLGEFRLIGHEGGLRLINPAGARQTLLDTVLAPGASRDLLWHVTPESRSMPMRCSVVVEHRSQGFAQQSAACVLSIPASRSTLRCVLAAAEARIAPGGTRFDPLTVTASIVNEGGARSDSIEVLLRMDSSSPLVLLSPSGVQPAPSVLEPVALQPDAKALATWMLDLPLHPAGVEAAVSVEVRERGELRTTAVLPIAVPPLDTIHAPRITVAGHTPLCPGDTVTLLANDGYASYRWNTGAVGRSIVVTQGGAYRVEAIDSGGTKRYSDVLLLTESIIDPPQVYYSKREPCEGEVIGLRSPSHIQVEQWSTGESGGNIAVTTSGDYFYTWRNAQGCLVTSDTVHVRYVPVPDDPFVFRNGDVLSTNATAKWVDWYRDGVFEQRSATLALKRPGVYKVRVLNSSDCQKESPPFVVDVLDAPPIAAARKLTMALYPDPVGSELTVLIDGVTPSSVDVRVVDVLGRQRIVQQRRVDVVPQRFSLDVTSLPAGLYLLQLRAGTHCEPRSFRKN